jgi:hypothetical protein
MRPVALLAMLPLLSGPVAAQEESLVVAACRLALDANIVAGDIQFDAVYDYADQEPPRAQFLVRTTEDVFIAECTFQSATVPLRLTQYCQSGGCVDGIEHDDPNDGDRAFPTMFPELVETLERGGF